LQSHAAALGSREANSRANIFVQFSPMNCGELAIVCVASMACEISAGDLRMPNGFPLPPPFTIESSTMKLSSCANASSAAALAAGLSASSSDVR
jgi:hypothetical protein